MNAMPVYATDFPQENASGSDSDSNTEESPEYYQPISAVDDDNDEDSDQVNSDEDHEYQASNFHALPNGYIRGAENGMSALDLNEAPEDYDSEEEEEQRMRQASDSAILRAFREDESRRNAPLTPENAVRVREAMRGISFRGLVPEWVDQVPEDQWVDQLRRLRQPAHSTTSMPN